ncbi:MAG: phosphatidate cytidylyltransferase [Candidatus Tectomicrobia bacterium]|nr:phosphatidate cytidylyltransferase [Candidatus Tectomicrobia bacterium]
MARFLSALALGAPVVLFVWFAPPIAFVWLVLLFVLRAGWEFQGLMRACGWPGREWETALDAAALLLAGWAGGVFPGLALTLILLRLLVRSLGVPEPRQGIAGSGVTLLGTVWLGGAGTLLASTGVLPGGRAAVLFLFAVVWANDVAAFYVGRRLGRRPLAPVISPSKTVEGGLGGLLAGAAMAGLFALWLPVPGLGLAGAVAAGLGLGLLAQVGDLCESLLKRAAGTKDASGLIPGHGGVLDRIDGLLLSAPPFYYLLHWLTGG